MGVHVDEPREGPETVAGDFRETAAQRRARRKRFEKSPLEHDVRDGIGARDRVEESYRAEEMPLGQD